MPDAQYWRDMDKATRYPPKDRKRMEANALKASKQRENPPDKAAKSKKPPTSSKSSALGTVAKAVKGIASDMGRAIAYEVNAPPPKRLKTKKTTTTKRRATTKPPAATKLPVFTVKPAWV